MNRSGGRYCFGFFGSVGSLPSLGAPVPEDPMNSLVPSGNVISAANTLA